MAADITLTAAKVAQAFSESSNCEKPYMYKCAATITKGQVLYMTTSGTVGLADGNGSGTTKPIGVALAGGAAGEFIPVHRKGDLYGYALSGLDYGALLYLSDGTPGAFYDSDPGSSIVAGVVRPLSDKDLTKVLYTEFSLIA